MLNISLNAQQVSDSDRRRLPRRELKLRTRAYSSDQQEFQAVLHDISRQGFVIDASAVLQVGQLISLDLPEIQRAQAQVKWRSGSRLGCQFLTPISQPVMSGALLAAEPHWVVKPLQDAESRTFSPIEKLGVIASLTAASWGVVTGLGYLAFAATY